eukprot:680211-Ditylum_brightwellii.AAC.1
MWQKDKYKDLKFVLESTVYEDNYGAIRVASCPKMIPISKFIVIKHQWFRQHVESGEVEIVKVESSKQLAYTFTKELQGDKFVAIRKLLCG